jgi:putative intracellular protease/amidase
MHTQVVLFDGFDPLDAIAPYEVLYAGGSATDGAVTSSTVTAEGPREVVSGIGGLTLRADPAHRGPCSGRDAGARAATARPRRFGPPREEEDIPS